MFTVVKYDKFICQGQSAVGANYHSVVRNMADEQEGCSTSVQTSYD